MKKTVFILFLVFCVCFNLYAQKKSGESKYKGLKKRIAVVEFENKSDYGRYNVGQGMSDMLTTALVKSGRFQVIERQALEKVMKEQKLGLTGAVTPQSAAQIGKILGVEVICVGSVSEFGEKKEKTGIGSKKVGGLGLKKTTARVAVDVRLINTTTAEIITAESVAKESSKRGISVATQEFHFGTGADFDKTLVGKATREAINEIVHLVTESMKGIEWKGKIIKANGKIYMKPGSAAGVKVGDTFTVYSKGEELIDPDTGLVLGAEEEKIGKIKVIAVKDQFSTAVVISGSGLKKGDIVRVK